MAEPLTADDMSLIKATAPALREHGLAITTRMYQRLFEDHEMKAIFPAEGQESGEQPKRLAMAILAYAENIDHLEKLGKPVERMTHRHVECGVKAEHYPVVANALLPAIKDILGDAATDEILAVWGKAYWVLAEILIGIEQGMYQEQ